MERNDWKNMSNSRIRENLTVIKHEQETLRNKVITLLDAIEFLEKEYFIGNDVIIKRMKGKE